MSYITHLFQHIFFLCCLRAFIDPSYMFPFSRSHCAGAHHNSLSTISMCTFYVRPNESVHVILRDTHLGGDAQMSSKATSRDWKVPPNTLLPAFKQTAESVLWRWISAAWHLPFWASVLSLISSACPLNSSTDPPSGGFHGLKPYISWRNVSGD